MLSQCEYGYFSKKSHFIINSRYIITLRFLYLLYGYTFSSI